MGTPQHVGEYNLDEIHRDQENHAPRTNSVAPGRISLVSRCYPAWGNRDQLVQMLAEAVNPRRDPDQVKKAARVGTTGSAQSLPHLERIQGAFGRHDVSNVRAFVGGPAADANAAMGSRAYASGDAIAFKTNPDLHTAAHEAAHIVQQRAGVSLGSGVGQRGDAYERQADQVADAVVANRNVEAMFGMVESIDEPPARSVQRMEDVQFEGPDDELDGGVPLPGGVPTPPPEAPPVAEPEATPPVAEDPAVAPDSPPSADGGGSGGGVVPPTPAPTVAPAVVPDGPTIGPAPTPRPAVPGAGNTPDSGTDWTAFWGGWQGNLIRTGLEVSRFVPGWGMLGGAAADAIEGYQNYTSLDAVAGTPAGERFRAMMIAREVCVGLTNAVGHVRYVLQLVQDGATISIVGVEIDAITVPANEALAAFSLGMQSAVMAMDLGITIAAGMQASRHGEGTPEYDAYHNLQVTFAVNTSSDVIGIFLDIADLATGGFANAQGIKQAKEVLKRTTMTAGQIKGSVVPLFNSWWSIWGPTVWNTVTGDGDTAGDAAVQRSEDGSSVVQMLGGGDQVGPFGMLRSVAGSIMMNEINEIEQMYQFGAGAVEYAAGLPGQIADDVTRVITEISGEKEPFIWLRDKLAEGITDGTARVSQMLQISSMAGQAQGAASQTSAAMDQILAALDRIQMPTIPEPTASDLGDNFLANAAESVVDGASNLGAAAIRRVTASLQAGIDSVKGPAKDKATEIKADMQWVVEFLTEFQTQLNAQTVQIGELGAEFSARLSQCSNIEEVFNMLISMGADTLGLEGFTAEDLRQVWRDVRAAIDDGFRAARAVAQNVGGGGASTPAGGDSAEGGGPDAASPAPASTAAGDGAPAAEGAPAAA